jgi:HTH-type transcriptional regulator/antitoxin HigA
MIRSLHRGLGIPAASLLGDRANSDTDLNLDWKRVPFADMRRRGWISRTPRDASEAKHLLESWMGPVRSLDLTRSVDQERLVVWTAAVAKTALAHTPSGKFDSTWSADFLRDVARISVFKDGPSLVVEFLDRHGIVMVVQPSHHRG